ncbi:MAG: hypothetical protein E6G29_02850 [Actinobacteria bacterium]|nr:MAG: hypothetical protein E6G29_02850 [Actinomycetota bacterium]
MEGQRAVRGRDVVGIFLVALAIGHLALGAYQLIDPGSFFREIGPLGVRNDHYTRDSGTFTVALGVAFAVAVRWPDWRLGVLGYAFFQYVFHSINHLVDINKAHPHRLGPEDFVELAVTAAIIGWLLVRTARERRAARW